MVAVVWSVLGLAMLVAGSELLVREGSKLAALVGIPPILIGLTVVSVGTSTPELAVGIEAALQGKGALAVGNIAGTNTFNILFILGLSALLAPLTLQMRTLRYDLPVMGMAALSLVVMAWDGHLTRLEGIVLVTAAIIYTIGVIRSARHESRIIKAEFASEYAASPARRTSPAAFRSLAALVVAMVVVVIGADWLVYGASGLARTMGVSDAFIGLTIVAIGTSAPELVTTVVSTLKGERDIAVGNLLGSGVYNILLILGVTALFPSDGIVVEQDLINVDIPVMAAAALLCIPVFLSGRRVSRMEGALLVATYIFYFSYLIVSRGHATGQLS